MKVRNKVTRQSSSLNKDNDKEFVMTRKRVFTVLALVVTALPATAQNQFLTSYIYPNNLDGIGPHVYYQAWPNADLWNIDPFFGWSFDMNLKPGYVGPTYTLPPLPKPHTPLATVFDPATQFPNLIYINSVGGLVDLELWPDGSFLGASGFENLQLTSSPPDGKSLTGVTSDSGPSVFWTTTDGSVWHFFMNGPSYILDPWENWLTPTPNLPCGVVNSALAALPDTRFSPNPLLVFFVGGSGHLCELAEVPGMEIDNQDITEICQAASVSPPYSGPKPCGDGAPQPMIKSPITGFSDSGGVHVFYLDTSGHVNELVMTSNGGWQDGDLQAAEISNLNLWNRVVCPPLFIGRYPIYHICPSAVADSLTSFANAFGPQLFYVDVNGHVNQINLKSNTHKDLTSSPGGGVPAMPLIQSSNPICTVGASLSSIGVDGVGGEDVYYIGNNQHVWELHSDDGTSWVAPDLTHNFGTPNVWFYPLTCP